jgi:flagellar basal-body rod protein FlgG
MNEGMYKSTTGMLHQATRLDMIAENLANSSVPGYKRTVSAARPFIGAFQDALRDKPEDGVRLATTAVDFTMGAFRHTERALDFAVEGKSFFVVLQNGQELYTRNGAFTVDPDGNLITQNGLAVKGDIRIPPDTNMADITVGEDGTLYSGKTVLGKLELASFEDPQKLLRAGPSLFIAPSGVSPDPMAQGDRVQNRVLEGSNTCIFTEMTEMITCMRNFEACQKMTSIQDTTEGAFISKLMQ